MANWIIAHDLGTSGDKAVLFDADSGKILGSEHGDYPTYYGRNGEVEQNPDDWWKAVCETGHRIAEKYDTKNIKAISFSGQMMGCVLVDKEGNALDNALIWADGRSQEQMDRLVGKLGEDRLYSITGLRSSPYYSITKLMWMKQYKPDVYAKAYKMILTKEYIVCKLTGKMATDYSDASGTMAFDVNTKNWSQEMMDLAEVDAEKFVSIVSASTVIGEITKKASDECGLPAGIPVVLGGGDGPCCRVGMGAVKPGRECVNIGTSALCSMILDHPLNDPAHRVINFNHILPELISVTGTMQSAGASITWMKDNLCKEEASEAEKSGKGIFSYINENAAKSPIGSKGLLYLPYLQGERAPQWNVHAKGMFVGLTMNHTANDMKRAVYEGIAMNLGLIHKVLKKYDESSENEGIILTGGAAKSRIISQTMADVFGTDMLLTNLSDEVGAFGAMIVAGKAIGLYPDLDMAKQFMEVTDRINPIEEHVRYFERLLPVFQESYEALLNVYPKLERF